MNWLSRTLAGFLLLLTVAPWLNARQPIINRENTPAKRLVVIKIDGLNADLLYGAMAQKDPATGKSRLPWFEYIFGENGTVFENFYTRGISLSAPSWSMLDTGHHTIIRGNVEFDRYTGEVYDYLNFVTLYIGYARNTMIDMPGVQELDRAGIPLIMDSFGFARSYQSFQLFQRGARWLTVENTLKRRFSRDAIVSMLESGTAPSLDSVLLRQQETELEQKLADQRILYLDYFTGAVDHEGHDTNDPGALLEALRTVDAALGRMWAAIQKSSLAGQTVIAVVSDHGMSNTPGISSQTYSLPDLLNSPTGGAHHVVTDREQFSDYKFRGLNPLTHRVITPSTASYYLKGKADQYPTAWLDIDGNERAAVQLRNSDLNEIHILLLQLHRTDLQPNIRQAAAATLRAVVDRHRAAWAQTALEITEEMRALEARIAERKSLLKDLAQEKGTHADYQPGDDKTRYRMADELQEWEREHEAYLAYVGHLQALLALQPDSQKLMQEKISLLVPEMSLGDNNTLHQLEHYIVGPSPGGLVLGPGGRLDEERSFQYVDNFAMLTAQQVHNNPQPALSSRPIDFVAARLPDSPYAADAALPQHAYFLFGDAESQLVILADSAGRIMVKPVKCLEQNAAGKVTWIDQPWRPGLPLQLFEDPQLRIAPKESRSAWLSEWHTEADWMNAIHLTRYSNGVIGITELLSPVADNVPGPPGTSPVILSFERRRRELVQADFHIFASDHWNFNVRFPNPGGNHGSFLRTSTHSVWMIAGAGVQVEKIAEPYDSLNFPSTILDLVGNRAPMPEKIVKLQQAR